MNRRHFFSLIPVLAAIPLLKRLTKFKEKPQSIKLPDTGNWIKHSDMTGTDDKIVIRHYERPFDFSNLNKNGFKRCMGESIEIEEDRITRTNNKFYYRGIEIKYPSIFGNSQLEYV